MKKFTDITGINESKIFSADPSVIKKYASRIIPFYITGDLPLKDRRLLDEWLDMNKTVEINKSANYLCDLEILAIKNIHDSPLTQQGYLQLVADINNKCVKLERFIRPFIINQK